MATADSYGLFWNSDNGDRKYNADSLERWLRKFFTSGVFEGDLQVLASSGMTVQIQTGYCNLFGKVGLFEVVNSITLDAANSRYPRIDTIVVERNDTDRIISLKKVNGSYSGENPQPTAPIWDETQGIYQLVLAQIYIGAGVSAITQANITDTRTDTSLCGYITGTVEEIDFAQITAQFEQYFAEFEQDNLAEFEEWFEHMKDQLSEDAAGHLQNEIGDLTHLETSDKSNLVAAINEEATEIVTMNNVLGAKNLLPNYATSQTINDVTFTVNSDGSITVHGTATADAWFLVNTYIPIEWQDNSYLLNGNVSVENSDVSLQVQLFDSTKTYLRAYGVRRKIDALIEIASDAKYASTFIAVTNGATVNETIYPMIRPASIKDDTYVPYAPINRNCAEKTDFANIRITGSTNTTGATITSGTFFYLNDALVQAKTDIASGATFTLNSNYEVVTAGALNVGGNVNFSHIIKTYSVSYTGSAQAFNVDYTLPEDAWVYISVSLGNGAVTVYAKSDISSNMPIFSFANYVSTSSIATSSWVKLAKGTRITTSNTTSNGIYQAQIRCFGVK